MNRQALAFGAALAAFGLMAEPAHAAGVDVGEVTRQATNWTAIILFTAFVGATLWITKWAAGRRLLHRWWRHHRLPERPGHCRRLHVCGLLPGHLRSRHGQRL